MKAISNKQKAISKKFRLEFSAGCVVYKRFKIQNTKYKIQYLLGKHSGYHKWVLPKGLIEKGEQGWQAAVRETEEEIGVKVAIVGDKPIYTEKYIYTADFKQNEHPKNGYNKKPFRRVAQYKENGGSKIKVFKTVTFFLAKYISGDPKNHGWEMSEANWFSLNEALKKMSFKGEKAALIKAEKLLVAQDKPAS